MIVKQVRICPYMGLAHDRESVHAYPSRRHRCFHARPAGAITLEYQDSFCLTPEHVNCPVFVAETASSLPEGIKSLSEDARHQKKDTRRNRAVIIVGVSLFILVLAIILGWLFLSHGFGRFSAQGQFPTAVLTTSMLNVPPTSTMQPTQTQNTPDSQKASPIPSNTPIPLTPVPTALSFRALETPIGRSTQLIIHRVREGESLDLISQYYSTTIEAIMAINYSITSPLLINALVVVPFNQTDVEKLPAFDAYQVQADISVDALANNLNVDPSLLIQYNQLNDDEILKKGDWVLVPHVK